MGVNQHGERPPCNYVNKILMFYLFSVFTARTAHSFFQTPLLKRCFFHSPADFVPCRKGFSPGFFSRCPQSELLCRSATSRDFLKLNRSLRQQLRQYRFPLLWLHAPCLLADATECHPLAPL